MSELKASITHADKALYAAYTNKNGPLSMARKYDAPAALVAAVVAKGDGWQQEPDDFMPYTEKRGEILFD